MIFHMLGDDLDVFMRSRIRAPRRSIHEIVEEGQKAPHYVGKETHELIKALFIDSFRRMIDFTIPPITSRDDRFDEFGHDPKVPLLSFLDEISNQTNIEIMSYPASLVLLRRLRQQKPSARFSINNMYRLLLVSIMIADKFLADVPPCNEIFANASRMDKDLVTSIELEFIESVSNDIFVDRSEIECVLKEWNFLIPEENLY